MERTEILDTAKGYVTRDRAATHGDAEDNFRTIANLWTEYLRVKYPDGLQRGVSWLGPDDVATMMVLFKVARLIVSPAHADNWIDIAGYAACGGEIATKARAGEVA